MYPLDDTIAAIASAPGGAARGIVRLSGPDVFNCLSAIFQPDDKHPLVIPTHPKVIAGSVCLKGINAPVPCDLFVWPEGRSYTGQMVAEFHTLGSPPLLDALLQSLWASGARMAEPGEFTLRAFLSGRIDLTQAEAVLGVIDAADPHEFQVAASQLAGGLAGPLSQLREMLLELLAHLEAGFDFADEDLPFITAEQLQLRLDEAVKNIDRLAAQMESRGSVQTTVRAVIYGRPNTGKSSLFNALTREGQALVSDMPGTTRDYLVAVLDFDGRKCQLIDTAGYHGESAEPKSNLKAPDQVAQQTASEQIAGAHIRLLCLDAARPLNSWEQDELALDDVLKRIVVWTKLDAVDAVDVVSLCKFSNRSTVFTSSVTGEGIDQLHAELRRMAHGVDMSAGEVVASTAARCNESLHRAGESLENALNLFRTKEGEEFIAAEIRLALEELGKVVGAVYTDDVLERIFSRFCVGK